MLTIRRLSIEDARIILGGAERASAVIGIPMCTAVVDESGTLLAFERLDGGKVTSVSIAMDKAFTAAAARRPTRWYQDNSVPGGATWGIQETNGGHFCVIPGGLPVVVDGEVVGGVGCSTGSADQDEEVARSAIDHFLASLNVARGEVG